MAQIRNLVFQGGGVKGSAYAGAVEVFANAGMLGEVQHIAGTSAGAITATLLACGAGHAGLMEAVRTTAFGSFLDAGWGLIDDAARLVRHYGVCRGAHFADLLGDQIARYAGSRDLTFAELANLAEREPGRYANLYVVTSNLTKQSAEVVCVDNHPDMPIWQAVRMSMSIPFIFEPVEVGGHLYVDGGLSWNYAIDLFDHPEGCRHEAMPHLGNPRSDETLGFILEPKPLAEAGVRDWSAVPATTDNIIHYAASVMGYMSEVANQQHLHADDVARTVFIDDLGVRSTDFKAPAHVIEDLIGSGARAASAYLAGAPAPAGR